jgi:hypothetical protein
MKRHRTYLMAVASGAACLCAAEADSQVAIWSDPAGDAGVRRTDPDADGLIGAGCILPDVVSVTLCGWEAPDPKNDPFTGQPVDAEDAHLFRLEVSFSGLVNPPGTLGLNDDGYDPFRFGPSPLYGFLDVDIDDKENTGGVLGTGAQQRYLANIGRFGRRPQGSIGERAAESANVYDADFFSDPQYERTGADWDLVFCGCFSPTIVSEDGNLDHIFDTGETWVVRGRFFERVVGYVDASDAFNGSGFGHYDPKVNLRFRHDGTTERTTVTLVYALDMAGAWALRGFEGQEQDIDLNVLNDTSIAEGLSDVIDNAGNLSGSLDELAGDWEGRDPFDYLDPTEWRVTALLGTGYESPSGALYAWTDTGFAEACGDVNGDGTGDQDDADLVYSEVVAVDGTEGDGDGTKDGRVQVPGFGLNFSLYDLDNDGWIDGEDLWVLGHRADVDRDGVLDIFDFLHFQNAYVSKIPPGDFDFDGVYTLFDFLGYVNAFNE